MQCRPDGNCQCDFPYSTGLLGSFGSPVDLTQALDYAFINQRPVYVGNSTFTFSSQTSTQAILFGGTYGAQDLVQRVTRPRSNISAGASSDVVSISLPTDSQCLLRLSVSIVQTDALTTNYCQAIKYVSARNSGGTATIQDTQTPYFFTAGIAYTVSVATSVSSVILRITCPAVPAGKKHNAFGTIELINVHNTL